MKTVIHSDGWRGYIGLVDLGIKRIIGYIMERTNLLEEKHMLMALKAFGVMLKPGCLKSVESPKSLSICL